MHLPLLSVVVFVLVVSVEYTAASLRGMNHWKFRQQMARRSQLLSTVTANSTRYVTQPLDHFSPLPKGSFSQKYYFNSASLVIHGPVFLYISGEEPLQTSSIVSGEHMTLAAKYGALVVAVEHRFYGDSLLPYWLEMDKMQYLNSEQALADLTGVYDDVMSFFQLPAETAWICFGGSYAGSLSAWFRLKYPHLVLGAIASSPPVRAVVNFEEYNDLVISSLSDTTVGGSQQCVDNVRSAFTMVDSRLDTGQRSQLQSDFKSCSAIAPGDDDVQLVSNLAAIIETAVQYSSSIAMNISSVCKLFVANDTSPYDSLVQANALFLAMTAQSCLDNSYASFIRQMIDTSTSHGLGLRQWYYQTCAEFGYYQTCDTNTTCPFSKRMTLQSQLDPCHMVFGVTSDMTYQQVSFTNSYYGADRPQGTRIVFVNGSLDPWHGLSVLKTLSSSELAIYIAGTSHCANMASDHPNDPPQLRAARDDIDFIVGTWLTLQRTAAAQQ